GPQTNQQIAQIDDLGAGRRLRLGRPPALVIFTQSRLLIAVEERDAAPELVDSTPVSALRSFRARQRRLQPVERIDHVATVDAEAVDGGAVAILCLDLCVQLQEAFTIGVD